MYTACAVALLGSLVLLLPLGSWHDQQRLLLQLPIVVAVLLGLQQRWAAPPLGLGLAVLGLAACAAAALPALALIEWAQLAGVVLLAWAWGRGLAASTLGARWLYVAALLALLFWLQIGLALLAALHHGHALNSWWLLPGFDNIRFFGQSAAVLLPLLLGAYALARLQRLPQRWVAALWLLLALWWTALLMSESRAALLGALLTLALCAAVPTLRRAWLRPYAASAVLGACVYALLFVLLPALGWVEATSNVGVRIQQTLFSDNPLSSRQVIWSIAWEHFLQHPLLGVGPMHFAYFPNPVAAHPHSLPLQLLSEWGLPFTLLLAWAAWRVLAPGCVLAWQQPPNTEAALVRAACLLALASAGAVSLFDGNFVMPYPLLLFALALGGYWSTLGSASAPASDTEPASAAVASHETARQGAASPSAARCWRCWRWRRWASVALLATVGLSSAVLVPLDFALRLPLSLEDFQAYQGGPFQPRLWLQGVIAWPQP